MKPKISTGTHGETSQCTRKRLAQGVIGSVDMCDCGMLQINIGALTVRMEPRALMELTDTLCRAEAAYSSREDAPADPQSLRLAVPPHKRGEA